MSFWSMTTTGEAVAGIRPRLTFCGMREPVRTTFSWAFFSGFTTASFFGSFLTPVSSLANTEPASRQSPAHKDATKLGGNAVERKRRGGKNIFLFAPQN